MKPCPHFLKRFAVLAAASLILSAVTLSASAAAAPVKYEEKRSTVTTVDGAQKKEDLAVTVEYRPNDILTENQMIEKFGVSKSPVREALVELCKDGVLINIPRMGYQVRAVTLKEIMDILEFRVDVEVGGLRKSFPVLTRENINMLRMIA